MIMKTRKKMIQQMKKMRKIPIQKIKIMRMQKKKHYLE
jgi:hypothetical protein